MSSVYVLGGSLLSDKSRAAAGSSMEAIKQLSAVSQKRLMLTAHVVEVYDEKRSF